MIIRGAIQYALAVSTGAYLTDTGAANAYVVTPSPALTSYTAGTGFLFKAVNANTGTSTVNVNGLGVKTIKKNVSTDLASGDILAGMIVYVVYDGTNFQLMSGPLGGSGGAGSGTVNTGTAGKLAYYAANGTAVSSLSNVAWDGTWLSVDGGAKLRYQWLDLPTDQVSGIGSGGYGANVWIGYASANTNFFSNTLAGDIAYRNALGKRLVIGIDNGAGTGTSTLIVDYDSLHLKEVGTPTTPVSGYGRIYGKSDGKVYYKNSAGTEVDLTLGGAGGSYTFSTGLTNTSSTITNNLSTGIAGGQTVTGGTGASDNLGLSSTTNATKGKIVFGNSVYDEANNRLGINVGGPNYMVHVYSTANTADLLRVQDSANIGSNTNTYGVTIAGKNTFSSVNYPFLAVGDTSNGSIYGISLEVKNAVYNIPTIQLGFSNSGGALDMWNYRSWQPSGTAGMKFTTSNGSGAVARIDISGGVATATVAIQNSYFTVSSLATGGTAPTTSGTTRMVITDANGQLSFQAIPAGGSGYNVTTVTVTTSSPADTSGERILLCDAATAGGTITVNLPTAVGNTTKFVVKKIDTGTNTVVVDGNASETIDGGLTATLRKPYESITIISNNANWFIM